MGLHTQLTRFVAWHLTSGVVAAGPFKGLRFTNETAGNALAPKLVGTYELELHGPVHQIIAAAPRRIVNVGAAEGYFAIGFARAVPGVSVVAYEAEVARCDQIRRLAAVNHVPDRVRVEGYCDLETFRKTLETVAPATVVMDIEGGEKELLNLEKVPQLRTCTILVEVHHATHANLEKLLSDRFYGTHKASAIPQRERIAADFLLPLPGWLSPFRASFKRRAMNEKKPPRAVSWLFLEPVAAAS